MVWTVGVQVVLAFRFVFPGFAIAWMTSLIEADDRLGNPADPVGVADAVNLDDLSIRYREGQDRKRVPANRYHDSRSAVDAHVVKFRTWYWSSLLSDRGNTTKHLGRLGMPWSEVRTEHNGGIKNRDEAVEITGAGGGEERIDHFPLSCPICTGRGYLCTFHTTSCSAGQLPRCGRRSLHNWSNLFEPQLKHVMKDKGQALGRRQGFEDDEESQPNRIREYDLVLWREFAGTGEDGIGDMNSELFLASILACPQHVEGNPSHDRRQPSAKVVDILGSGSAHADPRVLYGVVGLRD
jgi:hypothetical protein